jgi:spore maturation protein CgeB
MKIVIFGLSISSAWGNGHASLLRGLFQALHRDGHTVHFFERDTPYYASHRDAWAFDYVHLHLYSDWAQELPHVKSVLAEADVGLVTSYCGDGRAACQAVLDAGLPRTVFYDMDSPVTLARLEQGEHVAYVPENGLGDFDLVLSYAGGKTLPLLRQHLNARRAATLYGWVDPAVYHQVHARPEFAADLSYLGTYSADRQPALEALFLEAAQRLQDLRFVVGGAMYPDPHTWPANVRHYDHVAPPDHAAFYSSSPLTLNITRGSMAAMGYCPSGRLFEAAACGTAVLSDWWDGLESFFQPGQEILIATGSADTMAALSRARDTVERIGARARERALDCHTAEIRARRLLALIEDPRDEAEDEGAFLSYSKGAS